MNHWFTREDAAIDRGFVKRFDPLHWNIDFPRGTMASVVTGEDGHSLTVRAEFLRAGDLAGLIFESEDRHAHPAHRRERNPDYSNCVLRFRWQAQGVAALDTINGPTLTIEGRDASGTERNWYVRLWNYAIGSPDDAEIALDFNELDGGYLLPGEAERVDPRDIDRMFISLVPPAFVPGSDELFSVPAGGTVTLSDIRCDGSGSVLTIAEAVVPEHELRICTGYDDMYHLPPKRIVDWIERLGYRKLINHYVGMSHYFGLAGDGKLDPTRPLNAPAKAWHEAFAIAARARGYDVIWSISYELLAMFCPEHWKQRTLSGEAAATGYDPPSTLVSPASESAIRFLRDAATAFVSVAQGCGLQPMIQIGEPWWWVTNEKVICLHDEAAQSAFAEALVPIDDVRGELSEAQCDLLDMAGNLLEASTRTIADAVRAAAEDAKVLLLTYLPGSLDPQAPELRRANLPSAWAYPAFDVLQLEDYEWVSEGRRSRSAAAVREAEQRLGYGPAAQHYLAGFVPRAEDREMWSEIVGAASIARERGVAEVFIWALPQVVRDGLTLFGGERGMQAFEDVLFPIEIGNEASVAPVFSTAIVTSASGHEYRNANWSQARLRFDAGPGVRGDAELEQLIRFFRSRRGSAVGFRFHDPYDYSSAGMSEAPTPGDQVLGIGDGIRTRFPLAKHYGEGEVRRITRPVPGTVRVSVDGNERLTGWSIESGGQVGFDDPPPVGAVVAAGFLFDVPVRFAEDRLEINRVSFRAGEAPTVPLLEVREDHLA